MSKPITIVAGDTEFQKTLTEKEREYIHQGCNWIGKTANEVTIKAYRNYGYTLDQILELPQTEQERVMKEAIDKWNEGADWMNEVRRQSSQS